MLENNTLARRDKIDRQRFLSLMNSLTDAVITTDENLRVLLYNGAALNLLDVNTDLAKQSLSSVFKIYDKDNKPVDLETIFKDLKSSVTSRDYNLHYGDGSHANIYLSVAPVRRSFGESSERGFVILCRDITREKSLEAERDEFVSVISHELRTPIAIAEGNISNAQFIVEKSGNLIEVKAALRAAHDQILFLSDMMNDLSTLSRAERGKLNVEIDEVNIYNLIENIAKTYTEQAAAKGLVIKTELDPRLEVIHTSELYVREILQNFVTNALKYTDKGFIKLSAEPEPNGVSFSVSDSGIGISKQDQSKVFEKFFRSEDYRTRQTKGTGLGLYITQKLAGLIDAKISLESQLNQGTTFKVSVPNLQSDQPKA